MWPTLSWARCVPAGCAIMSLLRCNPGGSGPLRALPRVRQRRLPYPGAVLVRPRARAHALPVAGAVPGQHALELAPVDLAVAPVSGLLVELQLRVREGEAEVVALRHGRIDELLAQVVVGEALDLPLHGIGRVQALLVGGPEHHQHRPPVAVERLLRHLLLVGRPAAAERHHDLEALALMEALLLADADHRPGIGTEAAAAERDLVHDRRTVHQPADDADIGPGERRVVEDRGILGLAREQLVDHLLARDAERL